MAEAVTANYNLFVQADHTVALGLDDASDPTITHDIGDVLGTLNGSTTVAVSKAWSDDRALAAGADTITLTALGLGNLPDVDFTGLKVILVKITAAAANTAGVTFVKGASNPYNIWGQADGSITVLPGQTYGVYMAEQLPDVDATHKVIGVSGTDLDAAYSILLVAG